jgi:hypothetical protein
MKARGDPFPLDDQIHWKDLSYADTTSFFYLSNVRIPGQGGHDSEIIPVSIPKLIRSRFRDEPGQ